MTERADTQDLPKNEQDKERLRLPVSSFAKDWNNEKEAIYDK